MTEHDFTTLSVKRDTAERVRELAEETTVDETVRNLVNEYRGANG